MKKYVFMAKPCKPVLNVFGLAKRPTLQFGDHDVAIGITVWYLSWYGMAQAGVAQFCCNVSTCLEMSKESQVRRCISFGIPVLKEDVPVPESNSDIENHLRKCLRSFCKHLPEAERLAIINGCRPNWFSSFNPN